jgi:hypothetical protein
MDTKETIYSTSKGSVVKETLGDMFVYHIYTFDNQHRKRYTRREAMTCFRKLIKGEFASFT